MCYKRRVWLSNPFPSALILCCFISHQHYKSRLKRCASLSTPRQGLTAILGDVGLGKSSIIRYLFNEYDAREDVAATLIPSPNFPSEFAFLKKICADYGLPARRSMGDQENELRNFLISLYAEDKVCVVFIDEAQRLPGRQLELVRTLLNFETDETKLIQVVLSAQLELRTKLMDASKKALRSRIFAPSMLAPLSLNETEEMVNFRCKQAGVRNTFTLFKKRWNHSIR